MAMAGVGTGLQIGPLAIQARFSMSADRVAVVTALMLFVSRYDIYHPNAFKYLPFYSSGRLVVHSA
jgi:hypothetical protein